MTRLIVVIAALLAALGGSAVAASPAPRAAALLLHKNDFPAKATYHWGEMPADFTKALKAQGIQASSAYLSVTIPMGGSTKYKSVNGYVITTASAAPAKTLYTAMIGELPRANKSALRLPGYGDEQLALFHNGKVELLVRRNRVVWQLEVAAGGLLVLDEDTLTGELKDYAAMQMMRVGRG